MTGGLEIGAALVAVAAAGVALVSTARAWRLSAMALASVVAVVLVGSLAWDGPLAALRDRPVVGVFVVLAALALVVLLAFSFLRRPLAFPLVAVGALAFRVPVELGGETSNLLVPLYVVVAAGLVSAILRRGDAPGGAARAPLVLRVALAVSIIVYALAATYSLDSGPAVEAVAFFLVPFAILFSLLEDVPWSRRLLVGALVVALAEACLFALVAIGQQLAGEIFWNESLIASNEFHFYLRSNSLFWDPNVYGRYAAVAIVLALAALTWIPSDRAYRYLVTGALGLAWVGLLFAWSQSSFIALVAGALAVVALRYSVRIALVAAPLLAAALIAASLVGASTTTDRGIGDEATSGRSSLVAGGLRLAADRPLYGFGAGSFSEAFDRAEDVPAGQTTVSHTEPVTVLAEQGLVGFFAYAFLIVAAAWTLFGLMSARTPGLGGRAATVDWSVAARVALASAGIVLFVHTLAYAGNLTDPLTWTLLAVAGALRSRQGS